MSMERSVPPETAKSYLEEYSIKLSKTERGVMVIKTKDKTRASQRKGALSNWKVRKKKDRKGKKDIVSERNFKKERKTEEEERERERI